MSAWSDKSYERWALAGLVLALPCMTMLDGRVPTSQAAWLGLAASLLVAFRLERFSYAGAAFLALSAGTALSTRYSLVHGGAVAPFAAALTANQAILAGALVYLGLVRLFREHVGILVGLLWLLVAGFVGLTLADLVGLTWLHHRPELYLPGQTGTVMASPTVMAAVLGGLWPLFAPQTLKMPPRNWGRSEWLFGAGLCLSCLVCMAVLGSGTGWLAALAGGAGLAVWRLCQKSGALKFLATWSCLGAALALGAVLVCGLDAGAAYRLPVWIEAARGSRLLGHGAGSWWLSFSKDSNSVYVLVLWEYGWVGLALLAGTLWGLLKRAWQTAPNLFAAVLGLAVASGGTMLWERPAAACAGLVLIALVEVAHGRE